MNDQLHHKIKHILEIQIVSQTEQHIKMQKVEQTVLTFIDEILAENLNYIIHIQILLFLLYIVKQVVENVLQHIGMIIFNVNIVIDI